MVTARQNRQIAKLAKAGLTCRQVAAIVGLGENATRHRIAQAADLMKKHGARSFNEAFRMEAVARVSA